eukprot:3305734-Rhodomonas_salina.2
MESWAAHARKAAQEYEKGTHTYNVHVQAVHNESAFYTQLFDRFLARGSPFPHTVPMLVDNRSALYLGMRMYMCL